MKVEKILKNLVDKELEEEGITPEVLAMVDLEINYTPVIQFRGGKAVEAIRFKNNYVVNKNMVVKEDELKIMRARFLINRPFKNLFARGSQ